MREAHPSSRLACPRCSKTVGLWDGVELSGWRSLDDREKEAEWATARPNGDAGCGECAWEGRRADLVKLGLDGQPLPVVIPGQLAIGGER